jgi:F0F1-type ATP synthase membrane subunit b/b'
MYHYPALPRSFSHLTLPDRTKRVKDARTEAQKEIEEYRSQKESEFKAYEKEVRRDSVCLKPSARMLIAPVALEG